MDKVRGIRKSVSSLGLAGMLLLVPLNDFFSESFCYAGNRKTKPSAILVKTGVPLADAPSVTNTVDTNMVVQSFNVDYRTSPSNGYYATFQAFLPTNGVYKLISYTNAADMTNLSASVVEAVKTNNLGPRTWQKTIPFSSTDLRFYSLRREE